ncbi:terminase family protein [bacterium]|nr:terminase family protein [bacterium]
MSQDIKQIIKQEYVKCATDPVYFAKKYIYISHPTRGRIPFSLYPFQEDVLKLFAREDYLLILKSRQLGISTLVAFQSIMTMLFNSDKNILVICTKTDTAKNMVTKVKFMYDNLPSWLKMDVVENNKLTFKLKNGSQIKAVSAAGDSGRSEAVSLLIMDEAAFIPNAHELWGSVQQTLATGGGCIALSTPYGTGNWFHQQWVGAELAKNKFLPIKLPWTVHPERNETWRQEQDDLLGLKIAAQECDCDFATSGDTVFDTQILEYYEKTHVKEPIEKRGANGELWIWEQPDYSRKYMVHADVARGDGKDYSAFHIIDIEDAKQVAEFHGQLSTKDYGNILVSISTEYNDALLVVENANIGWAVLQQIIDREYRNLYYSPKSDINIVDAYSNQNSGNMSNMVPGFTTSMKTRPLIIQKLESYLRERSMIIQSKRSIEEMKTFIWRNNRAEAQSGYNDDLVMSLGIGLYVRDTALRLQQSGIDLTRASLNNIGRSQHSSGLYSPNETKSNDQWDWNVGDDNEGLTWLL